MSKVRTSDALIFALCTLLQAVVFVMWPDSPPFAAYLVGTGHGCLWYWALTCGSRL